MNKIYTISRNDRSVSMGRSSKLAWRSPRFVIYHLKRRSLTGSDYKVHTIDLVNGTVSKCSAVAFLSAHVSPEKIQSEIQARFGFSADLAVLESMYNAKVFNDLTRSDVKTYLISKGISA